MSTVGTAPTVAPSDKAPEVKKAPTKKVAPKKVVKKTDIPRSLLPTIKEAAKKPVVKVKKPKPKKAKDPNKLTPNQIRVLQALKRRKHSIDRADLKDSVGIGRDKKYSGGWLTELWSLNERGLIKIEDSASCVDGNDSGHPKHMHRITAKGIKALDK